MKYLRKYFKLGLLFSILSIYLISAILIARRLDSIMYMNHIEDSSESFAVFIQESEKMLYAIESRISNLVMWVALIGIMVAFLISKLCTKVLEKDELNFVRLINRILISVGFLAVQYSATYIPTQADYRDDVAFVEEKNNHDYLSNYEVEKIELLRTRYKSARKNGINVLSFEAVTLTVSFDLITGYLINKKSDDNTKKIRYYEK